MYQKRKNTVNDTTIQFNNKLQQLCQMIWALRVVHWTAKSINNTSPKNVTRTYRPSVEDPIVHSETYQGVQSPPKSQWHLKVNNFKNKLNATCTISIVIVRDRESYGSIPDICLDMFRYNNTYILINHHPRVNIS